MSDRSLIAAAFTLALALAGCGGDDVPCEVDAWQLTGGDLHGVVLSAQGRAADDMWLTGGGIGTPGFVRHWDGDAWNDVPITDGAVTWWWSWTSPSGVTWLAGDLGRVVRHVPDGTVTSHPIAAEDITWYGVWGSGDDDVWFVGEDGNVMRWDGAGFVAVTGLPAVGTDYFKVWGTGPSDIWISGESGTMIHWNGTSGVDHRNELNTFAPALTVHGCSPTEVYAVAGQALYAWDGTAWARRSEPVLGSVANGVSCGPDGVLVVGNAGLKVRWERASGATGPWIDERDVPPTGTDLHGAWIDPAGTLWAVGGNFNDLTTAPRVGYVGTRGCPAPRALE